MANRADLDIIGRPEAEVLGKTDAELFPPQIAAQFVADDQRVMQSGQPVLNREERLVNYEGKQIRQLTSKLPLKDTAGQIVGLVGIGRDITEHKRAEEALKEYSERLEEMVAERTLELQGAQERLVRREKLAVLGQLAGGVGHELRNPLGIISNAVYYLNMVHAEADETTQEYLQMISDEVRNADKIVHDLLDFSRIKASDKRPVTVSDLIHQALIRSPSPEEVKVSAHIPGDLPTVLVDPRQMEQVLANLITNAFQAMPEGGDLTISVHSADNQMALAVTDTGCGISPENMNKLFEPLFTTKARGIGLGLAVSKNLVEVNGGSMEVESKEDQGSTFTIRLPLA